MTKQEALKEIEQHVADAYASIRKAEAIADKHGVMFSFGVAYGMGGSYIPVTHDWESSTESGWASSSNNC